MSERVELPSSEGVTRYQENDYVTEIVVQPTSAEPVGDAQPPTRGDTQPTTSENVPATAPTAGAETTTFQNDPTTANANLAAPTATKPVRTGGTRNAVDAGDATAENGAVSGQADVNAKTPLQERQERDARLDRVVAQEQDLEAVVRDDGKDSFVG